MDLLEDWEKDLARRDFRARQIKTALVGSIYLVFGGCVYFEFFAPLALLFFTVGRDEILRFHLTGSMHQTRLSIWLGATPHDAAHRYLLNGWSP